MKPFTILLIRILAIHLALNPLLSVLPFLFSADSINEWLPVFVAAVLIPVGAGLLLWFSAGLLAKKIYRGSDSEPNLSLSEAGVVRAGSFLIGVYLFIQHIGIVVSHYMAVGLIAYGSLVVIVLSLGLMLGTRVIATLYRKIKYAGSDI